jgi:hypothetical protein
MKKVFTILLIGFALFASVSTKAQIFQVQQDFLPGGDLTADDILYVKLTLHEGDTSVFFNEAFHLAPVDTIRAFGDYSCQIRAREDLGYFDVRDQGGPGNQMAIDTLRFKFDQAYHCWINVVFGIPSQYDLYMLEDGKPIDSLKTIAESATFRNDLQYLSIWSVLAFDASADSMGMMDISNMQYVNEYTVPVTETGIVTTGLQNPAALACSPNPIVNSATISYNLDHYTNMSLAIYDLLGNQVIVLDRGYKASGNYHKEFDGSELPRGIYFSKLQTNSSTYTQKLIFK